MSKYGPKVSKDICILSKRRNAQTKPYAFGSVDLVSIIGILWNFKVASDSNRKHKAAEM